MPNLNKVMLMGNLTRDPELKYTPKGKAVTEFGLAVNRSWTTDSGEKREEVTFVDITMFGRVAEIAGEYLKKGYPAYIEGRLQLDTWDDKQTGAKRSKLKVIGDGLQLIGGKSEGRKPSDPDERGKPAGEPRSPAPPARPPADPDLDAESDDIPF